MSFDILTTDAIEEIAFLKPLINVGCGFDIPTGTYLFGKYGESVLNGGVGAMTGITGIGNNFKSTLMHYLTLAAASCFSYTKIFTYDTELNIQRSRLLKMALSIIGRYSLTGIFDKNMWSVTDRSIYFANEWYEKFKDFMEKKIAAKKNFTRELPFVGPDGSSLLHWMIPTFGQVDSLTLFETSTDGKIIDENELGESAMNTYHMRTGLAKMKFLSDVLRRGNMSNTPMFMTAHIGKDIPMDARAAPVKKLQHLKNGDKIKGVTDMFFFLTSAVFQCQNASPFLNDTTKAAEYPLDSDENKAKRDTDLNLVTAVVLRNKNGPTGHIIPFLVSQREGVLPSLSEFHYCKENNRFGLIGNLQNYAYALRPSVSLSRTTVRGKLNTDEKLRRVANITMEMLQMKQFWHQLPDELLCTPQELYDDLIKQGYDWDILLDTRGWWTLNNDNPELKPFLSTMDLLRMRKGFYHPYWLADDKKTRIDVTDKKHADVARQAIERAKNSSRLGVLSIEEAQAQARKNEQAEEMVCDI